MRSARRARAQGLVALSVALITLNACSSSAPITQPRSADQIQLVTVASVSSALDLAFRTGDDTLFVVSRSGFIAAIRDGTLDPEHVLDIAGDILAGGEQGLLGLAFANDGKHAYVNFTNRDGNTVVAEFAVDSDGSFDPGSKRTLLEIDQPYSNHNGGSLQMGPDSFLYIGMGDGGAANDPERRSLDTGELLGKILRIDPTPDDGSPYAIPSDNPFANVAGARAEIWATGVRNPWRFSFDRSTGDLWIGDVGQDEWEEIDVAWADQGGGRGANFGWSAFEGTHRFNDDQSADGVTKPFFEYAHGDQDCSISGGVRYRGTDIASLVGWYVYGDYCAGQVRALQVNADHTSGSEVVLAQGIGGLSAVTQGPDGELYVLSVDNSSILALRAVS